jgi:hypothetical protein
MTPHTQTDSALPTAEEVKPEVFVKIPLSALTTKQRDVLDRAPAKWGRLPSKLSSEIDVLARCGLVEIDVHWRWSRVDPGAVRYVNVWRRA